MNLASILWSIVVVDLLVISSKFATIFAQAIRHTEYLNRQPVDELIEQEQIEDERFVYHIPIEIKPLDQLDSEFRDDFIQKELSSGSPTIDQERKRGYQEALKVTRSQNTLEQEVYSRDNKIKYQDLVRRINQSTNVASVPDNVVQYYELTDSHKARKYATTTARPAYDQIPRPLLFDRGQDMDSFE